jgi:hypothetical protein
MLDVVALHSLWLVDLRQPEQNVVGVHREIHNLGSNGIACDDNSLVGAPPLLFTAKVSQ